MMHVFLSCNDTKFHTIIYAGLVKTVNEQNISLQELLSGSSRTALNLGSQPSKRPPPNLVRLSFIIASMLANALRSKNHENSCNINEKEYASLL